MKASRFQRPSVNPSSFDQESPLNDLTPSPTPEADDDWLNVVQPAAVPMDEPVPLAGNRLEVDLGESLRPGNPAAVPLLSPVHHADAAVPATPLSVAEAPHSMLAEGLHFVGNALLQGPCTVACHVEGNLIAAPGCAVSVVVTETGRLMGDVTAQKISVMGHADGLLDAGQGEVVLYETASVHGLVRYGRIQVNGADLNATLERAARG